MRIVEFRLRGNIFFCEIWGGAKSRKKRPRRQNSFDRASKAFYA